MSEMNQPEIDLSLKLFVILTRTLNAIKTNVEKNIRKMGLNPTEFSVLELLYSKGEQPIQKIGEKVLIASSSITYVVDKLEKKNYLRRKPCADDRRVTFACITEEGRTFMEKEFPKHKEAIHEIMAGLNKNEKEQLIEHLKQLGYYADTNN